MARAAKPAKKSTKPKKPKVARVEPVQLGATGIRQDEPVTALAVSHDGKLIASGDGDGGLRVFDAATGACVFETRWRASRDRSSSGIAHIAFSPDGTAVAGLVGSGEGNLCVAHIATGATWFETKSRYKGFAYAPDGASIAATSMWTIELVDARDGTCTRKVETLGTDRVAQAIAWASDGTFACVLHGDEGKPLIATIDAETLELRRHDPSIGHAPNDLAFAPDGRIVAVIDEAAYPSETHELRALHLDPRTGAAEVAAIAPGLARGTITLVASLGAAFVRRHRREGTLVPLDGGEPRAIPAGVHAIAASTDGASIATASGVTVQLFDAAWTPRSAAAELALAQTAIAFAADGQTVVTCDPSGVRVWGLDGGLRATYELEALALLGPTEVLALRDERAVVVDLPSLRTRPGGVAKRGGVPSPDGKLLATRDYENARGCVVVMSLETGEQVRVQSPTGSNLYGIAFSPDGTRIVSGSWDRRIAIHDAATGEQVASGSCDGHGQQAFSFSPDGRYLASGDHFRTVRLWKLPGATVAHAMRHQRKYIRATAFSPDGTLLASCDEVSVRVWSVATGKPLGVARSGATCLAFSPDGTRLAAGGQGEAWIYDVATLMLSR